MTRTSSVSGRTQRVDCSKRRVFVRVLPCGEALLRPINRLAEKAVKNGWRTLPSMLSNSRSTSVALLILFLIVLRLLVLVFVPLAVFAPVMLFRPVLGVRRCCLQSENRRWNVYGLLDEVAS